ncbi:MAG: pyridoxal phosphate-dependent aminotransferase [Alphaproteobacteria bacterium]|nr:pyridoxal phosphate-dependent aminotransferase [Alphaproteobacteria bacterium]
MVVDLPAPIRAVVATAPLQEIVRVADYGSRFDGVIPFWYGESDLRSPDAAVAAAKQALDAGETRYTVNAGIPDLRAALAEHLSGVHAMPVAPARITVTSSGMSAIATVMQTLVGPGDNVVLVVPLWPNADASVRLQGGEPRRVELRADREGRWHLDLDAVFAACDERTRALFVNSPNNPTGWMATAEELAALVAFCRERRIWLIADEVYSRIVYAGKAAPSVLDHAAPDDPVLGVGSFSKSWAMTGWRLGWLVHPPAIGDVLSNMIQYTTSGAPAFVQHGALAAVRSGEAKIAEMRKYCADGRTRVTEALGRLNRVRYAEPDAAFYAFFQVDGEASSMELAKRLVSEARIGLAPGTAFDPSCEGWLRLCFAQSPARLGQGLERLVRALA